MIIVVKCSKDSNLLLSTAVYELTQTNALEYDFGTNTYRQTGKVRSREVTARPCAAG